ncbi:DUF6894 family protein [Microvirga aerilata]|uniref:DUF6894 family protein n=1 Tax=Microvirga aerilata TaxID=670292 RepID=UPI00362F8FB2
MNKGCCLWLISIVPASECLCLASFSIPTTVNSWLVTTLGQDLESFESAKAVAQAALPEMAKDELPDGDQRVFMVSVRDEADQVVIRAALTLVVEYPSHA